jgi:hypothetical protein
MKSIFVLLVAFVAIGLCFHSFNGKTRLLILFVAACMVAYVTLG